MKTRFIDSVLLLKNSCLKMEEEIICRFSISPSEYRGLLAIEPDEVLTGNAFSARMNLSVSRGSRVIDKLINSGFLQLENCTDDRRCNSVSLSAKGRKVKMEINNMLDECEEQLLDKIPGDELNDLKKSFNKLTEILNKK